MTVAENLMACPVPLTNSFSYGRWTIYYFSTIQPGEPHDSKSWISAACPPKDNNIIVLLYCRTPPSKKCNIARCVFVCVCVCVCVCVSVVYCWAHKFRCMFVCGCVCMVYCSHLQGTYIIHMRGHACECVCVDLCSFVMKKCKAAHAEVQKVYRKNWKWLYSFIESYLAG